MSLSKLAGVDAILHEVDAPIKNPSDGRKLVELLRDEDNMKQMKAYVDSLKKTKTVIKRHSSNARHAEAMKESLFEEQFFRTHCAFGERRGKEPAEFNFATTGTLKELMTHPFGEDAEGVWKIIFHHETRAAVVKRRENSTQRRKIEEEQSEAAKKIKLVSSPFDKFFSPVLASVEPGMCGFTNLGVSCYLNAILQCLGHIDPFRAAFDENFKPNELN